MKTMLAYAAMIAGALALSFVPAWADNNAELIEAIAKGDVKRVESLISKGSDVNEESDGGWTALALARGAHLPGPRFAEIKELLISKGAK